MKYNEWYGYIPSGWEVYSVENLINHGIIFQPKDGNHGSLHPKNSDYVNDGIPFIMASDIVNGEIDYLNCKKISKNKALTLQKGFAKNDDVLLTHKATIGRTTIVNTSLDFIILSPQVTYYRIKTKEKLSSSFLKCLFETPRFKKILENYSGGGSTRDYIGIMQQQNLPILFPPIKDQIKISNSLLSIDQKIDLLRRQNETLEQIAQSLFKRWFVDFEFPDENGRPYKSFGGKMIPSELGEIPEGWRVGTINDIVSLIIDYRGKTPKKLGRNWSPNGIPALSAKNIKDGEIVRKDSMYYGSEKLYRVWMKDEIKRNDILLTSEAPLGEVFYIANDKKYILSQRLFAIRTDKDILSSYLYYWLKSNQGQFLLNRRATGTTVIGIRQEELRKVEIIIPEENILRLSNNILKYSLLKKNKNSDQIENLKELRDTLLPNLMSGQIRINE